MQFFVGFPHSIGILSDLLELTAMPTTGTSRPLRAGVLLATALTIPALSGCGGSHEPEKNIKPGSNLSAESQATIEKLKSMSSQIDKDLEQQKKHKEEIEKKAQAAQSKQIKKKGLKQPFR